MVGGGLNKLRLLSDYRSDVGIELRLEAIAGRRMTVMPIWYMACPFDELLVRARGST